MEFSKPDEEGLTRFLIDEKGFGEDRVESIKKRLRACINIKPQLSLEAFFGKPQKVHGVENTKEGKRKTSAPKSNTKKIKK